MNQIKDFFEYIFNSIKIWIIVQPWQQGIRVRKGSTIKKLSGGIYFRIPYIDSIYIQETRLRVASLPIQTLTSKDLKTVTLSGSIGYSIRDLETLYNSLYHPETTISNMAMSEMSDFVFKNNIADINPSCIEEAVLAKLNAENYGLHFEYFRITSFAVVRTLRLIQDQSWLSEGLEMDQKK